jgi:HEXXH motif-containing protein
MIGPHVISSRHFDMLASGGGDRAALETLVAAQFSRRMLLLQAVRESACRAAPAAAAAVDAAYALLADVQRERPDVLRTVLTLPCTGQWAAACLRDADDERNYRYLGCLAATAAYLAGREFEIEVPVWDRIVYLPALGSASLGAAAPPTALVCSRGDGRLVITAAGESVRLPLDDGIPAPGWRPTPLLTSTAHGLNLTAWLNDAGPFRDPGGLRLAPPVTEEQAAGWGRLLSVAWELLVRRHPEQAEGLATGLRSLIPLQSRGRAESISVTNVHAFGAILLTPPLDAEGFALTLLHESQHGKLGAIQQLIPLHRDDSQARWYAPWRDDPRPLNALLHGAYAHLGVAGFWHAAIRAGDGRAASAATDDAMEELAYCRDAVGEALGQLSGSGELTAAGGRFVAGMTTALGHLGTERIPERSRVRATERGICNRMVWRMRHLRPDPVEVDDLARAWLAGTGRPEALATESRRPPAAAADVSPCPGERGNLGSSRLLLARRAARQGDGSRRGDPVAIANGAPTAADINYVHGRHTESLTGYRAELIRDPGDPGAWAGLALTLRHGEARDAVSFLTERPELVRAVAIRVRELYGDCADPIALTEWIA